MRTIDIHWNLLLRDPIFFARCFFHLSLRRFTLHIQLFGISSGNDQKLLQLFIFLGSITVSTVGFCAAQQNMCETFHSKANDVKTEKKYTSRTNELVRWKSVAIALNGLTFRFFVVWFELCGVKVVWFALRLGWTAAGTLEYDWLRHSDLPSEIGERLLGFDRESNEISSSNYNFEIPGCHFWDRFESPLELRISTALARWIAIRVRIFVRARRDHVAAQQWRTKSIFRLTSRFVCSENPLGSTKILSNFVSFRP